MRGCGMQCRIELEQARLLVLEAADQLDRHGNKKARGILAMAKVKPSLVITFFLTVLAKRFNAKLVLPPYAGCSSKYGPEGA